MRLVTLHPEWAHAIVHMGKRVENRGPLPRPTIGERIAIHAGKYIGGRPGCVSHREGLSTLMSAAKRGGVAAKLADALIKHIGVREIIKSAVVATARVTSIIEPGVASSDPWYVDGSHGWVLEDVVVLDRPLVNIRGAQGLWLFSRLSHSDDAVTPKVLYAELKRRQALSQGFAVKAGLVPSPLDKTRTAAGAYSAVRGFSRASGVTASIRLRVTGESITEDDLLSLVCYEAMFEEES